MPRFSFSSSSMICMARTGDGAGREAGDQRVERVVFRIELALDVGDDMHDLAVALDEELVGDLHARHLRYAPGVVAAQIEQHEMLGALLGVGRSCSLSALSSCGGGPGGLGAA